MVPERALSYARGFSYAGAMRSVWIVVVLAACGGNGKNNKSVVVDSGVDDSMQIDAPSTTCRTAPVDFRHHACNPLTQTGCNAGEKCTWLMDASTPQYVGHIGCAPDGTAALGATCMFGAPGATGYDNCVKGLICSNYRGGSGVCRQICDNQGGAPMCPAGNVCNTYSGLFSTGDTTPAAAGMCDPGCSPLDDNDFDGSGTALTKTGTSCTGATVGCYGYPSFGTAPTTGWACTNDINYNDNLRHRTQCTEANGCADPGPTVYVNSCNQGYLPLLRESTGVSTVICVAMCKPGNAYAGNPCTQYPAGQSPHACNNVDARGTFNTATTTTNGEHCVYSWYFEIDDQGNFLQSGTSDSVGFCYDHTKYLYDSNGDNAPDAPLPPCASLQIKSTGMDPSDPLTYFGASDLGCVESKLALPMMNKKRPDIRILGVGRRN